MNALKSTLTALTLLACGAVFATEPVNINTADAQALAEAINGVGLKRAEAIVSYRNQNGPFKSVDELVQVQGVGEKTLEKSRERLTTESE
ncbi:MAG TPA: ComEA family DNA-binding protein [Gammaproteobacteria bacterium]|nr:ComEA family DNA-binding protein [Gammaproteobacteria bacterium]